MAADPVEGAIREHAQQARLQLRRHVADLVEKQRAALGLLEAAAAQGLRAGEGAALVAEQLGLEQVLGHRRGVDGDERLRRTGAVPVQRPRDQLLAGAGLAGDQHRGTRLRQPPDGAKHLLHRRRLAEDFRCFTDRLEPGPFPPAFAERPAYEFDRLVDIERLGQVFVGAALERRDRGFQIRVRRHHDYRHARVLLLHLLQQLDARGARHAHVGHQHLRCAFVQRFERIGRRSKRVECHPLTCQGFFEHPAYRAVIINDPDRHHVFPRPPRRAAIS